ncbi:MAG: pyridoxamine kinase [Velocimicrobium sp.]
MERQKKIAVINDISGFGRCSITVALPIISHMKVQCCPLPTSIFSNHTGYKNFFFDDYTDKMPEYIKNWKKLGLDFDGIVSGFLGSTRQIQIVEAFIQEFCHEYTKVIIDPVMGEDGNPYTTYTKDMCEEMKKLVRYADIITPNVTESCMLTDTSYKDRGWKQRELYEMAEKLIGMGAKKVAISGIKMGDFIGNVVAQSGVDSKIIKVKRVGSERAGTGDIYSSILAADCVNGVDFETSVKKAAHFIKDCIMVTENYHTPKEDGVCFEEILARLK